jgi:hypothetical protein
MGYSFRYSHLKWPPTAFFVFVAKAAARAQRKEMIYTQISSHLFFRPTSSY